MNELVLGAFLIEIANIFDLYLTCHVVNAANRRLAFSGITSILKILRRMHFRNRRNHHKLDKLELNRSSQINLDQLESISCPRTKISIKIQVITQAHILFRLDSFQFILRMFLTFFLLSFFLDPIQLPS